MDVDQSAAGATTESPVMTTEADDNDIDDDKDVDAENSVVEAQLSDVEDHPDETLSQASLNDNEDEEEKEDEDEEEEEEVSEASASESRNLTASQTSAQQEESDQEVRLKIIISFAGNRNHVLMICLPK